MIVHRLIALTALTLPLLGCPDSGTAAAPTPAPGETTDAPVGGQVQQQQQSPTSKPASRPAGHPTNTPKQPEGPKLTFAINPEVTVSPRVDVKLDRIAILPLTKENLESEPVDLTGVLEPAEGKHYVAIVLRVTVDGKPWSEIDDGTGVEKVGPFAIEFAESILDIPGTGLSDPERPDVAYLYRLIPPPVSKSRSFAFRAILSLEEGHTLLARFNNLPIKVEPAKPDSAEDEPADTAPKPKPEDGK